MTSSSSEPSGAQRPRVSSGPTFSTSAGREAVALAASAGVYLDDWQAWLLEQSLGERVDGMWAATQVGLIVPRQNGKGEVLLARALAGLFLFEEQLLLHSAHEFKTAKEAYLRIRGVIERSPDLLSQVRQFRYSNEDVSVELHSGQRLRFVARSTGSGRGFTGDVIIFDEAYNLPTEAVAAMLPTLSARPNPQIWYASSAGMDSSETLASLRDRGTLGDERLFFAEWSASPDCDLDDHAAWAEANPALGRRISVEFIEGTERPAMGDAEFARERLGIWSDPRTSRVIDETSWAACADVLSRPEERFALAVDVSPDRATASVALAGLRDDDLWHVELDEHRNGVGWLLDYIVTRCERNDIRAVVIDAVSPAASIIDALKARRVKVTTTGPRDMAKACGSFFDAVYEDRLRHIDQPQVNAALGAARKRVLGDAWAWNRQSQASDITPLVACTLALWGAQSSTVKKPSRSSTGRRAALVL